VKNKSKQFNEIINKFKQYLAGIFTNERGKNSFDGKSGYEKYLKNRVF
jgi:hypothetical protein